MSSPGGTEVRSEFQPLRSVIVHLPGREWEMVPLEPNMAEKYLVEDILYLKRAREDHQEFTSCLKHITGEGGVIEFSGLLADILRDDATRTEIVEAVATEEKLEGAKRTRFATKEIDASALAELLISGSRMEYGDGGSDGPDSHERYFHPIPNILFTRDIGAAVGDSLILSHPARRVRHREGLLARFVFQRHELFSGTKLIDILSYPTAGDTGDGVSLEGGDILALDSQTVVVGSGERSSEQGVRLLTHRLLEDHVCERVIVVAIPADRATMHLDTVFTVIGPEDCVYYPPLFEEGPGAVPARATTYELVSGRVSAVDTSTAGLFPALARIGHDFRRRVKCGGDLPLFQAREQWTDGANLFAVKETVAFIYERNRETVAAFKSAGYQIVSAKRFLESDPETITRTLVTINGAELSRGRGGSRCMTLPISRSDG